MVLECDLIILIYCLICCAVQFLTALSVQECLCRKVKLEVEKALARAAHTFEVGAEMFVPVNSSLHVQQDAEQTYNAVI